MFITLTYQNYSRSNGQSFLLKADLIERISHLQKRTGSSIVLTNGSQYTVRESLEEIQSRINHSKLSQSSADRPRR